MNKEYVNIVKSGTYHGKLWKAETDMKDEKCRLMFIFNVKTTKDKDEDGNYYKLESYVRKYYKDFTDKPSAQVAQQHELCRTLAVILSKPIEEVTTAILPETPHTNCCAFFTAVAEYLNKELKFIDPIRNLFALRVEMYNDRAFFELSPNWISKGHWSDIRYYSREDIVNGNSPFKISSGVETGFKGMSGGQSIMAHGGTSSPPIPPKVNATPAVIDITYDDLPF